MTEDEKLMIERFGKYLFTKCDSQEFAVQICELAGSYLNLKTISDYAKQNKLSYNGVKNNRQIRNIFNVKFVIDNL